MYQGCQKLTNMNKFMNRDSNSDLTNKNKFMNRNIKVSSQCHFLKQMLGTKILKESVSSSVGSVEDKG